MLAVPGVARRAKTGVPCYTCFETASYHLSLILKALKQSWLHPILAYIEDYIISCNSLLLLDLVMFLSESMTEVKLLVMLFLCAMFFKQFYYTFMSIPHSFHYGSPAILSLSINISSST